MKEGKGKEKKEIPFIKKKKKDSPFHRYFSPSLVSLSSHVVLLRFDNVLPIVQLLPLKRSKSLLLGHGIDISPDDEGDKVKERHPCMGRQELLREQ